MSTATRENLNMWLRKLTEAADFIDFFVKVTENSNWFNLIREELDARCYDVLERGELDAEDVKYIRIMKFIYS